MLPYALSFLAGLLTALSPCVLPALPLIASGAERENRWAPLAVALGMILSFTTLGVFFATVGSSLGLDAEVVRLIAALLMTAFGLGILLSALKLPLPSWLTFLANHTGAHLGAKSWKGLSGQFLLGTLLGALWSPCVGPTLGATITLATSIGGLGPATLMMLLFGIGSSAPLVFIAYGSRRIFQMQRHRLKAFADYSRPMFALLLIAFGIVIIMGADKQIEATLVNLLPERWVELVTRY